MKINLKHICSFWIFILFSQTAYSQDIEPNLPKVNIRLSFLLVPFTPLSTLEVATVKNITLQLETNFNHIHGVNIKYYLNKRMDKGYIFVGSAFLQDNFLTQDLKTTFLPYVGYGYVYRFGISTKWIFDSRIGIGPTLNSDNIIIFPVIKTGIGRIF